MQIELQIEFVEPGMKLAKNHVFKNYEKGSTTSVDLREGFILTDKVIEKLRTVYNVKSLYIDDPDAGKMLEDSHVNDFDIEDKFKLTSALITGMNQMLETKTLDLSEFHDMINNIINNLIELFKANKNSFFPAISSVTEKLDSHDQYTHAHSVNVTIYALVLALSIPEVIQEYRLSEKGMKATDQDIYQTIAMNMLLHDVGKLMVNKDVLNKDGKLTDEEFNQIKSHPRNGWGILHKINEGNRNAGIKEIPATYMVACLTHHQNWDGYGYPSIKLRTDKECKEAPLVGREIPLIGRICGIADMFDALTSARPYRKKLHTLQAFQIMEKEMGKKLDPELTKKFLKNINIFPVGSTVKLSNGDLALVTGYHNEDKYSPICKPYMRKLRIDGEWKTIKLTADAPVIIGESSLTIVIDENLYEKIKV